MLHGSLSFTDGQSFDTQGLLRVTRRSDGYYVIGQGYLIPVDSREEGDDIIADLETEYPAPGVPNDES